MLHQQSGVRALSAWSLCLHLDTFVPVSGFATRKCIESEKMVAKWQRARGEQLAIVCTWMANFFLRLSPNVTW